MDLAGLSRFITDTKAYQDYSLNEYEMLKYFLEQTQPRTIQIVGGFMYPTLKVRITKKL